jgi:hypothetical protein
MPALFESGKSQSAAAGERLGGRENAIGGQPTGGVYREGDRVVLAQGSYQGTLGTFLRLKDDIHWADITELNGEVRSHPVIWLAHASNSDSRFGAPTR